MVINFAENRVDQKATDLDRYVDRLGVLVQRHHAETALTAAKTDAEAHAITARAAMLEAESANMAKSHFLANMSHELRTPLNAIIGFSEFMSSGSLGPDQIDKYREYSRDICEAGNHLLELINDILDLSKIEANRVGLTENPVNFGDVIEASVRFIEQPAQEAGLSLVQKVAHPLPPIFADKRKLKQVLVNLLSNALKFTPQGGEIVLGAGIATDGSFVVEVKDNGIGIAPGNIERVLDPFTQVENTYTRRHQGTGLGLPLSRSLIELHGGTLTLESEIGFGTRVTIRLPAHRVQQETQNAPRPELQTGARDRAVA